MSQPSDWPLANRSVRLVSPVVIRRKLETHPLARDCYPLAAGYYETAYSHRMSRRRHDDNILIYCFAGEGFLETERWRGPVRAGELVLLPSGQGHRYRADDANPWSIYWCHFSGTLAPQFVEHLAPSLAKPIIPIGQSATLIQQFQGLLHATGNGYNITALVHAANMLRQLLTSVALILEEKSNARSDGLDMAAIQAFMLQNLDKPLDLAALAQKAGISKYHFSKKYKTATGFAPIQHLIQMKMEYARYLLETSDIPVGEIAAKVGYDDALYFSRQFHKMEGVSPTRYRLGRIGDEEAAILS